MLSYHSLALQSIKTYLSAVKHMHVLHSHAPLPAKPRLQIVLNVGSTPAAGFGDCGRLCPVWALLSYVAGRPDATPLTKTHFVGAVRLALRQAGLEPRVYAGYSFSHWHCHYGGGGWPGGLIHPVPGLLVQRSFFGIYPDDPRATLHHFANSGPHHRPPPPPPPPPPL